MGLLDSLKSFGKKTFDAFIRNRSLDRFTPPPESKPPQQTFPVGEGLSPSDQERAPRAVIGAKPEDTQAVLNDFQADPAVFRGEIKQVIADTIRSGELDSKVIKSNVRAFINQKVNEQLLSRVVTKPPRSVSGFIQNAKEDVREVVDGIGVLIGLGLEAASNPVQTLTTASEATKKLITSPQYRQEVKTLYIDPLIEEYKEYRNPLTKIYEDPFDVFLDVTALFSFGGTLLAKSGAKTAQVAARSAEAAKAVSIARKALRGAKTAEEASIATKALKAAQALNKAAPDSKLFRASLATERVGEKAVAASRIASLGNISKATREVVSALPGGKELIANLGLARDARRLLQNEQLAFLNSRNRVINEIDKRVNRLTPEEVQALPLAAEGFTRPPVNASKDFYEALGLMRSLAKDQQRFGLKAGALTPEIIERRRFQPLAKWLEREGKLESKVPYEKLTGGALRGRIAKIREFFPEADPIYMRHFFDDKPKTFSSFFLNTKPVRSFKPGFLKKSYGKAGYIGAEGTNITKTQLKDILGRQASENVKWQRNIKLLERLKNDPRVLPLTKGADPLPGYQVFAPDGFIRFYKGTMDLASELRKKVNLKDDVWDAFEDAVDAAFPKQKSYIGVTKAKLYQAPEAMAKELSKQVASSNPYIKLFWDKPLDAFRFAVLSLYPRWNFNNVIGNAIFSIVSGDIFNPKAFYSYRQARQAGLLPDDLFGGVHRVERTTSGRLGAAAEIPLVKSTVAMHNAVLDTRVIGQLVQAAEAAASTAFKPILKLGNLAFRANAVVDDMFKGVGYINRALKNDRKGFLKRMVTGWDETRAVLEKTGASAKVSGKLIDDVHKWYYHGLNLTDFERRAVRRLVPFYSWMRWATLYSYRITTEAPVRANIIANMARDLYTFTGQNKLPEWMRGAVPIGTDEDGTVYYLKTRGANPFSVLNDFMSEGLLGAALQGSAPGIKTVVEQATGEEVFLGRPFTKDAVGQITDPLSNKVYRFDPELGTVVEVPEKIRPGVLENLLRNYIPQYLLMEVVLTGGKRRYTAEGLDTILADLFRDESERKAIVKDIITKQGKESTSLLKELGKGVGINIQEVGPDNRRAQQESLQRATGSIKNKELPILNPRFKNLIKQRVLQEISEGTPRDEIRGKVRLWIERNTEQLKQLAPVK